MSKAHSARYHQRENPSITETVVNVGDRIFPLRRRRRILLKPGSPTHIPSAIFGPAYVSTNISKTSQDLVRAFFLFLGEFDLPFALLFFLGRRNMQESVGFPKQFPKDRMVASC